MRPAWKRVEPGLYRAEGVDLVVEADDRSGWTAIVRGRVVARARRNRWAAMRAAERRAPVPDRTCDRCGAPADYCGRAGGPLCVECREEVFG